LLHSFSRIATTENAGSNRVKPILNRYVPATTVVEHLATAEELVRLVKILQFFNCENPILQNHEKTVSLTFITIGIGFLWTSTFKTSAVKKF
jgi:hypothetical protein